jgi:hypothetical protein
MFSKFNQEITMKRRHLLVTLIAIFTASAFVIAAAADWKDALKEKFASIYTYSKRASANPDRITSPGTILIVRKDGISGDLSTDLTYSPVSVRNGKVRQTGGILAAFQNKKTTYLFRPGDRVYVTDLKVDDDKVSLLLMSVDTTAVTAKGSTQQTRYKASVQFAYEKKVLPTVDFEKLKADIEAVLAPESVVAAASTKTIGLNQTPQEVEAILGKPETVVNLGPRVIYTYKTMKIIFVDGKVTDVQ